MQIQLPVAYDPEALVAFSKRWHVAELAVFGSLLRHDFDAGSDVDVLLTFAPGATHTLLDYPLMEAELAGVFGRAVDVVNRLAIEESHNWIRRRKILGSARVIYAA